MLIETQGLEGSKVLVAVSGGSDSIALLHLLKTNLRHDQMFVATVDHGLRPEAAEEAEFVAKACMVLKIPHQTLKWSPDEKKSSQAARLARYELLVAHARDVGCQTIALGHTLDDQAETLVMRSLRAKPNSGTRGLSGMTVWSSYEDVKLWRPLLEAPRNELRKYLNDQCQVWIDDPSNEKTSSERVRIRRFLSDDKHQYPSKEVISKLAAYSARSRHWLGRQTARLIDEHCSVDQSGHLQFTCPKNLPNLLVLDTLSTLVLAVGGMPFRSPISKLKVSAKAAKQGTKSITTIGRCLVSTNNHLVTVEREDRNIPPLPKLGRQPTHFDGTWLLADDQNRKPFIAALERFRTDVDDEVYFAVQRLVENKPFPLVYST